MEKQEVLIIKNFCRGNRKSIFSIPEMGLDLGASNSKLYFAFKFTLAENGFVFLENDSDENKKLYIDPETNTVIMMRTNENNKVIEVNRITQYTDIDDQLNDFKDIMSLFVELYGAPYDWSEVDSNITECSWDAINGVNISICFNRVHNQIICLYFRLLTGDRED